MPPDCCRPDYDAIFDDGAARRELRAYQRRGATGSTRTLVNAIRKQGVDGASLLDVGGGVGVIGAELLTSGAASLVDVDASRAYLEAARSEIYRRGYADRATFEYGDAVELAPRIEPVDVVTLDRVICCYPDWVALVDATVGRSRRLYGLVYPRDRWWVRAAGRLGNLGLRLFRQSFRFHVHPERAVDARIRAAGFEPLLDERGLAWQTVLYRRVGSAGAAGS